ncbi:NACHT domain-containing protein [Citrobacter freundii]|uniref:NACHT domain-containing protein n=1 Tax=Citrobacter freundii TaxID=546 RepID=UPI002165D9F1|nr:ATP-binding protein [Citrobacter freundii]MDT7135207.1 ATP-binding protein [Citrobacter freundii]MDT7279208.1 ATP-binding protein [Citrobacter freundii]MEB1019004.1 ATP-binding protein [Citrobacter freundii]WIJ22233.1 ATP-binding protein [Citrobacter freundii]WOQ09481.1 ATP-binding protein [Citrobacter freundii]
MVSKETLKWLDDTEVVLTHRAVTKVTLRDIYVSCDMKNATAADVVKGNEVEYINSDTIISKQNYYLITGEEQQGKTSLLKNTFRRLAEGGIPVVYIDARNIKTSDIDVVIGSELKKQYDNFSIESFLHEDIKTVLIDGIDFIGLNNKYRDLFLSNLKEKFQHIIITCNTSYSYIYPEIYELNDFSVYDLLGLGHAKRTELIEKWISLGKEESIDESTLYEQCDEFKLKLDTIIRKNIVPPKPIYVLILLQMFEAYSQQNLEMTSYGHCYQQLVYQSFDHAKIPKKDVEKYLNVLTELAWRMHTNNGFIPESELPLFFKNYGSIYLTVNGEEIIKILRNNSILFSDGLNIRFKYPYLFYFFAAKKIAEQYVQDEQVRSGFRNLLSSLHREDYANILVFVTHHTKDSWVLTEIKNTLSELFHEQQPATLNKDQLTFMSEFIAQIPELILEQREIKTEREKHDRQLDKIEKVHADTNHSDEDYEQPDILAKINKTFKGMEVSGQIIRNRYATLTRQDLYDLASNGSETGLRFLDYFIQLSNTAKTEIVSLIENTLKEHPNLTDEQISKQAKHVFLQMTYGVINGVIRKIASSIGSREASEIYSSLKYKDSESPAIILLNQAIELQFMRIINIPKLSDTTQKLKGNPVCLRILKEMVIQHTYMFPVGYKEKQQIAELLDLSVKQQRIMDSKKIGKA